MANCLRAAVEVKNPRALGAEIFETAAPIRTQAGDLPLITRIDANLEERSIHTLKPWFTFFGFSLRLFLFASIRVIRGQLNCSARERDEILALAPIRAWLGDDACDQVLLVH